jgi:parvulin-like peptidyl-prolyl isomerase
MKHFTGLLCLFLVALWVSGCEWPGKDKNRIALVVGSRHFSPDELKREMQFLSVGMEIPESEREGIKAQMLERIIDRQLIMEYAKDEGISVSESEVQAAVKEIMIPYSQQEFERALLRGYTDFDRWKARLREQVLVGKVLEKVTREIAPPGYAEIKAYFEANRHEFRSPPTVRFRQIVTRSKQEAEALKKRLEAGEDMGTLAKRHSIAPEAERGGEVGWVAQGQLDESMDSVLFSLPLHKISPVIETPYGYHLFQVLSVRPEGEKELPAVIGEIEAKLTADKRQAVCDKWLADLRGRYKIKIDKSLVKTL